MASCAGGRALALRERGRSLLSESNRYFLDTARSIVGLAGVSRDPPTVERLRAEAASRRGEFLGALRAIDEEAQGLS